MKLLCPHCQNPIDVVDFNPREEIACPSCGSSFKLEMGATTTAWQSQDGKKLGKFDLLNTIGQGAFGTVYRARDTQLDRIVAVKVPRTGNLGGVQEQDRFLREARSAAQLRHPSIVNLHEVGESGGVTRCQQIQVHDLRNSRPRNLPQLCQLGIVSDDTRTN